MNKPTRTTQSTARRDTPVATPAAQRKGVAELFELVKHVPRGRRSRNPYKLVGPNGETSTIPDSVFVLFERVVESLARGDAVSVVPTTKELSTQEAADILDVSRQYVIQLLDEGRIAFHRTGTHRRIRFDDLLAFKHQRDEQRMTALDELARLSEAYGGYDEIPGRK